MRRLLWTCVLVALGAAAALLFSQLAAWGRAEGRRAAAELYEERLAQCERVYPRFRCEAELGRLRGAGATPESPLSTQILERTAPPISPYD